MKLIYNNVIPFKGYKAITIAPFIFVRKGATMSDIDINHESIHIKLQLEMLWLPFFIWYGIEWLIRLFINSNAYRSIWFELEAYANLDNLNYLSNRKHYAWFNFKK